MNKIETYTMKNIAKSLTIIFVLLLGGLLFLLSNHIGGFRGFTVMSASMEPAIPTGALVITQQILPKQLQSGDIITFLRPDNTKEFITHRISKTQQHEQITTIKTKGDNNKTQDKWTVAGGSVIGRVIVTIPYAGYILSFSQTKIGIALFILIPAFFILLDELNNIINLFTRKDKSGSIAAETAVIIFFMGTIGSVVIHPSNALLTDSVTLTDNQVSVLIATPTITQTPTATPTQIPSITVTQTQTQTPTPPPSATPTQPPSTNCSGNTIISVSNNGAGSANVVTINNNCSSTIHQSNNAINTTTVSTNSSTGNNQTNNNSGITSIITGHTNTEFSVKTSTSSNVIQKHYRE